MKHIKDLGFKSKEGIEVKDLQRFPSMEWGEEGGLQAEIYFNGVHVMRVYQEGNGGCACTYNVNEQIMPEFRKAALEFLKRTDDAYTSGEFSWLVGKTPEKLDDDDFEAVVLSMENHYDTLKEAKKAFNKGAKTFVYIEYAGGLISSLTSPFNISGNYALVQDYLIKNKKPQPKEIKFYSAESISAAL